MPAMGFPGNENQGKECRGAQDTEKSQQTAP